MPVERIVNLESTMDVRTKALWDFNRAAYKSGLMNEFLGLLGSFMDPNMDMIESMGAVEDAVNKIDLVPIAKILDEAFIPLMKALADDNAINAQKNLLIAVRSVVDAVTPENINRIIDTIKTIVTSLLALKSVALSLAPVVLKLAAPSIEASLKGKSGEVVGGGINAFCDAINKINDKDPEILSTFITNVFATVDAQAFRKTTDILIGNILDQKPPLVGWTTATLISRMKKRFK